MPRKNKGIIVLSIIFIAFALALLIAGGALSGWDFKAMFVSKQAICAYIVLGLYLIVVLYFVLKDWVKKL